MGRSITSPGVVKSVQRGVSSGNATITISAVDIAKCSVTLQGARTGSGPDPHGSAPRVTGFTSTSLTVAGGVYNNSTSQNMDWSWQVVEFF
jgi:hypothetical protein